MKRGTEPCSLFVLLRLSFNGFFPDILLTHSLVMFITRQALYKQ